MTAWKKVFRSAYLDPAIDAALETRAKEEGVGKGALIVAYIEEGLCLPGAPRTSEGTVETTALQLAPSAPKILRTFYVSGSSAGLLGSRASSEGLLGSRLVERFCVEGLSRPSSGGGILRRTQESFVAEQKAKIAEIGQRAHDAYAALQAAQEAFAASCPHLQLSGNLPIATCQDCGAIVTRSS